MRRVLFHRDYQAFRGAQMKVRDYFDHVDAAPGWEPVVHFPPSVVWDAENPWLSVRDRGVPTWEPYGADLVFVSGTDWEHVPEENRRRFPVPIVNLVQAQFHAVDDDPRRAFLGHRAVRICISAAVRDALAATGAVNGPMVVIPNGIHVDAFPAPVEKTTDLVVVGMKEHRLARQLKKELRWRPFQRRRRIDHMVGHVPRAEFLARINRARVAVFLPKSVEGFYLPAIEAMAMRTLVVCPDVGGNRAYCEPDRNCFLPAYDIPSIVGAVRVALDLADVVREDLVSRAREAAERHDVAVERKSLVELLEQVDALYVG